MKVILVEGLDNCGKTSLIDMYNSYLQNTLHVNVLRINIIHLVKPEGNTYQEQADNIDKINSETCEKLIEFQKNNEYDYVILDRAWYSEYVYGQIYRHRTSEDLRNKLKYLELSLMWHFDFDDIKFVYLTVNSPIFLLNHEDGLSLSTITENAQNNILKNIRREMSLFDKVFDLSLLPNECKLKAIVNADEHNFIDFNNILTFLKEK